MLKPNGIKNKIISSIITLSIILALFPYNVSATENDLPIIKVSDVIGYNGETIEVSVDISNIIDMAGAQFDLVYDNNIVNLVSVQQGEFVKDFMFQAEEISDNTIRVIFFSLSGLKVSGNGNLLKATFKLLQQGECNISLTELALQDATGPNAQAIIQNGVIQVKLTAEQVKDLINDATTVTEVKNILETYSIELGLVMTDYNNLSETEKLAVAQAVLEGKGAGYQDVASIVAVFNNAVTQQQLKNEAIQAAIEAINNLPSTITLEDKEIVEAARALVEEAKNLGATEADITNIEKLVEAENVIAALEEELNEAIQAAIEAINNLPSTITLEDKQIVEAARALVEVAVNAGANESDITNLDKLIAAETRITELEQELSDAIQAAIEAINNLPSTIEFNNPEHAALVENARALVEEAFALGATETDISNYAVLLQAEAALEHGFLAGAINIPFDNYNLTDVEAKFMLDDILLAILKLDFTNGIAVIPNDTVKIPIMNITDSSEVIVLVNGFIGKVIITPAEINNGDIFDLSSLILVPGDVNGDGLIDIQDVALLAQMFNEITTDRAYDLNGDGEVNVKDLYYIGKNFD